LFELTLKAKLSDLVRIVVNLPLEVRAAAVALLALLWVFWPSLSEMAGRWGSESQYSHGYVVPLFAGFLLWFRKDMLPQKPSPALLWGIALLLAGLGLRFFAIFVYFDWLSSVALLPCLAGICLLAGGPQALRWAWPAIGFLIFMVPLPHLLQTALAIPLQRIATLGTTYALQTLGFTAFSEGNIIRMGDTPINVAEACSGLSMLLIFFALSTAVVLVSSLSPVEKGLIFVSAIPIALIANIVRISVTGILSRTVGGAFADNFHESFWAGCLVMILGLGLLWLEVRLFSWILEVPSSENVTSFAMAGMAGTKSRGRRS
jgi:exosortase